MSGLLLRSIEAKTSLGLIAAIFAFLGLFAEAVQAAEERILSFRSDIQVLEDASLLVSETITVLAQGQEIKRGIIRDFPLGYQDRYGNQMEVGFELLEVLRDGRSEPHSTRREGRFVKIIIGHKDVFLPPGEHRYRITYRTTRQLGFFEDFDELYWNVTGNGWSFTIDQAEAYVRLPQGAPPLEQAAYTGPKGAQGKDFDTLPSGANLVFRSTRPLAPGEGLTLAVSWPKGYVAEPDAMTKLGYSLGFNAAAQAALAGFVLVFIYYALAWLLVGRDPRGDDVSLRVKPPQDLSPAAMRYVIRMGFDNKAFAAALVSLAVKGRIKIEEVGKHFRLQELEKVVSKVSPGERRLADRLFQRSDKILLKQTNHKVIGKARGLLKSYLKDEYDKVYFKRNRLYFFAGLVPMLATLGAVIYLAGAAEEAVFMCVWLTGWTAGCLVLLHRVVGAWRAAFSGPGLDGSSLFLALFMTAFSLPFLGAEAFALHTVAGFIGLLPTAFCFAMIMQAFCFFHWLKAPTRAGRKLLDEIESFKRYLGGEKERLDRLHPPEETPELFEAYLPYALALDVENAWCERFSGVLGQAEDLAVGRSRHYRPHWYHGNSWHDRGIAGLGESLGGSLSGAAGSAASAPGSSSGSGGGGSSGGGGGGGGGSGW